MAVAAFQRRAPTRNRPLPLRFGKPAANQPAVGPAPSLELGLDGQGALMRLRQAGAGGVAIGGELPVTLAIRLELIGFVRIDHGDPQRVFLRRRAP